MAPSRRRGELGPSRAAAPAARSTGRALWHLHRAALWVCRGPLRRPTLAAARAVARAAGSLAARGEADASVYARGGIGRGDFVAGLSDVDVIVVAAPDQRGAGIASERMRRRWRSFERRLAWMEGLVGEPRVYDDAELAHVARASGHTWGLDGDAPHAAYRPDPSLPDRLRALDRPGLYGTTEDWVRVSGRERRPRVSRAPDEERIAAWLELAFYWRLVFPALLAPERPRTAFICVKLVAEPARIWLWLAHGERAGTRRDALDRALRRLPAEEKAIRAARALEDDLHRAPPPPLADAIGALTRISTLIAELLDAAAEERGTTTARVVGSAPAALVAGEPVPAGAFPLCDWRALVSPTHADEHVLLTPDDPADPDALRKATAAQAGPAFRALRRDDLLVMPASVRERVRLRSVGCPVTDPVTFALLDGRTDARFPELAGWSLDHVSRRAVAEAAARLASPERLGDEAELVLLFGAARAALVRESVLEGTPMIPVTATATAELLGERSSEARVVAADALGALRDAVVNGTPAQRSAAPALRRLVERLPVYAGTPESP